MHYQYIDTPIGLLEISATDVGLHSAIFIDDQRNYTLKTSSDMDILDLARQQLNQYFDGNRKQFDIPLAAQGTDFQQSVWHQLTQIPFGATCSYADIANKIKNPKAVRAVGGANGKNPISIIVPCHRVIGANQTLTGYAGGLSRKAWLLEHENAFFR